MLYRHIQKLCDDRNLTIADLSLLTGISRQAINLWDCVVPKTSSIEKVAEVLHVTPESLLMKVKGKSKKCEHCGKEFALKSGMTQQVKYCSPECKKESRAKRKKKERSSLVEKTEKAREMGLSYGIYTAIKDGYIKGGLNKCQGFPKTHTTNFIPVKVVLTAR